MATPVYLEVGSKKVFACTVDWAGWCRSGKTEEAALEALATYTDRYRPVAERAGVKFPRTATNFEIVERVKGSATTDFGAPGEVPQLDHTNLTPAQAKRLAALTEAGWVVFDAVVATAPAELRKGPRGGGRDRDKIVGHVVDGEVGYARQLGLRVAKASTEERRAAIAQAIRSRVEDTKWPARYAARRIAWHVLDHAWEIEDRSEL